VEPWLWAVLLLVLGLLLLMMEIFFPSAGILAFLSAASLIGAIILAFQQGIGTGALFLFLTPVGTITFVILAFKFWPKTSMGRRMMLATPPSDEVLPEDPEKEFLQSLVGRVGKTKCKMLPSGIISIDGRKIDAVSEGMPIEVNQEVRVLQVRGKRVIVRPLDEDAPSPNASNPLRRPIEELVDDPFDNNPPG
jgi:membrane-bound ClpP family serine protease